MLKFDKSQEKSLDKRLNASRFKKAFPETILSSKLDSAFCRFNGDFEFVYEPKGHDFGWHPSGDCLPTVTELWTKAMGSLHPDKVDAPRDDLSRLNKTFMVGHYWHQIIQFLMVKEGWADQSSIERVMYKHWSNYRDRGNRFDPNQEPDVAPIYPPFHYVRGQGDIAPLSMNGWRGLVDIKTMNPMDFKAGFSQSRFARKYTAQLNIYMDLFDLDQALILAVDKGSSAFQEYTFVRDQSLIDQIYRKWKRVSDLLDTGKQPTPKDDKKYELVWT